MPKLLHRMKQGYGKHHALDEYGNRVVIRPGQTLRIEPELLAGARDKFELIEPVPPLPEHVAALRAVSLGENQYNIIHPETNAPINDVPLTHKEAYDIIEGEIERANG